MSCLTPFRLPGGQLVACGKCEFCQKRRINDWFIRLLYEAKVSDYCTFATFTYNDDSLYFNPETGEMTVFKKHLQDFHKRLRKYFHPLDISVRYFVVSEYGGEHGRPHYHGIYFFKFKPDTRPFIGYDNTLYEISRVGTSVFCDSALSKFWDKGFSYFGQVNESSIRYVLKYILKDENNSDRFTLMSRNPGIGLYYVDCFAQWHRDCLDRQFITLPGGVKIALPRYYKDKIYTPAQKRVIMKRHQKRFKENQERLGERKILEADIANHNFREVYKDKLRKKK